MATTYVSAGVQMIALQEIRTDRNVRQQLAAEELEAFWAKHGPHMLPADHEG